MSTLVYAPEARVHIRTAKNSAGGGRVIDVTEDMSSGSVTRIRNGISTAQFTLLNQTRKYDGVFSPMDTVVVYLRRLPQHPVLKFSGYLDSVPMFAALPGSINLTASCTLKRLQNWMWDPTSAAAVVLLNRADPNASASNDGGLAQRAVNVLTQVAQWAPGQIHISRIPDDWYNQVAKVADKMIADAEATILANESGTGAWVNGTNPVTSGQSSITGIGPGTGTLPDTSGKCSEFGGPGGGAYGNFALTGESGTHPRDGWYCAMRWPYVSPVATVIRGVNVGAAKAWWTNRRILVVNPKTNKAVVCRAADWGPNIRTGRVIDLAPHALQALGAVTNDTLHMSFAPPGAALGPFTATAATTSASTGSLTTSPSQPAGGLASPKTTWGLPGQSSQMVQARAGGCTFTVNRRAKANFEGFVNDLVSELGYHPQSIGGYSNRNIAGSGQKSNHAWGAAIDIDPTKNPRYGSGAGGKYALPKPPAIVQLARKWGLYWGGEYRNSKDYMHFEVIGAPSTPTVKGYTGPTGAVVVAKWTPPVHRAYVITKHFGDGGNHWASGTHSGTDFAVPAGTPIYPVGPGTVHAKHTYTGTPSTQPYGNDISIDHGNNVFTFYGHMNAPSKLSVGDHVTQDSVIGHVGQTGNATGPHVHLELRVGADTYTAATQSGGIEKYVLGGSKRSDPPAGVEGAAGAFASPAADAVVGVTGQGLFNAFMHYSSVTDEGGRLLSGYRALMNDTPVLNTIAEFMGAGMRDYCSAPNGDFIAWFPDYFGHFKMAGKMVVSPLEIDLMSGPPTIGWDDTNLKTHQFVSSAYTGLTQNATDVMKMKTTAGVASVESPELMQALFNMTHAEAVAMGTDYLERYGARPEFTPMNNISGPRQEFFMACYLFQQNFSQQYQTTVNFTFMPELFPGMLACIPAYGIQGYVVQTVDSWDLAGGGFTTSVSAAPWSSIGSTGPKNLPRGATL